MLFWFIPMSIIFIPISILLIPMPIRVIRMDKLATFLGKIVKILGKTGKNVSLIVIYLKVIISTTNTNLQNNNLINCYKTNNGLHIYLYHKRNNRTYKILLIFLLCSFVSFVVCPFCYKQDCAAHTSILFC
jgi:hypothetical protein